MLGLSLVRKQIAMGLAALAVMLVGGAVSSAAQNPAAQVAFARAAHLKRGINLSMWYAQAGDYSNTRLNSFTVADDFKLVKSLGFDHVRLSINPEPLIAEPQNGALKPEAMAQLDKSLKEIEAAGLVVVLDIHAEQSYVQALAKGDDPVQRFYGFWTNFAKHYAGSDPAKVYFEILNEPNMDDVYRWAGIQARAVQIIRAQAPHHTIIVTGAQWGNIDGLLTIEPVRDDNIIYSFHDYDPMWFTHQGATWGSQAWSTLHGVPYPSSPESVAPLLPLEPDARVQLWLARYGLEHWDHKRLEGEIDLAAAWAKQRNVPLWCGEFGVYREFALPAMRVQWLADMRRAFEARGIGWSMWDYQGGFGLVTKHDGVATADPAIVAALGMSKH